MGGSVYFCWPDPVNQTQSWQLLGNITNSKPSSIFKISNLKKKVDSQNLSNSFMQLGQVSSVNAQVGISVEPLANIELHTPAAHTEASNVSSFMEFSQNMLENLFNYASSFPLSCLQTWYSIFERRLQQNPNFWKK